MQSYQNIETAVVKFAGRTVFEALQAAPTFGKCLKNRPCKQLIPQCLAVTVRFRGKIMQLTYSQHSSRTIDQAIVDAACYTSLENTNADVYQTFPCM